MRALIRSISFVVASGSTLVLLACGERTRPSPSGETVGASGGSGPSSSTSAGGPSTASSSGTVARGPDTCEGAIQLGEEVPEIRKVGGPPPPLGGPVEPGIYVLTEVDAYEAGMSSGSEEPPDLATTGVKSRKTLYVAGNLVRAVGARSGANGVVPQDATEAWTFGRNGTALDTRSVCPTSGSARSLPYSSVGPALSLFPDETHREVYLRR